MDKPTDPTDPTLSPVLIDRLETIVDALATSNRAARRNLEAVHSLHVTFLCACFLIGAIYYTRGRV